MNSKYYNDDCALQLTSLDQVHLTILYTYALIPSTIIRFV